MPDAASDDENAVAAPICTAASRRASKFAAASWPVAFTFDMAFSKSAEAFTANPKPTAATAPTFSRPSPSVFIDCFDCSASLARSWASSFSCLLSFALAAMFRSAASVSLSVDALACPIFAWKSEI